MTLLKLTIRDVPLDNRTVLVRSDFDGLFNVSRNLATYRVENEILPTIRHLLSRGCKVVVVGHVDKANQQSVPSFESAARAMANSLATTIRFADILTHDRVYQIIKRAPNSSVIVLENLGFLQNNVDNSADFAKKLITSTNARYFVQDAPRAVHKDQPTTRAITMFIPSVAGLSLERLKGLPKHLPGIDGLLDVKL